MFIMYMLAWTTDHNPCQDAKYGIFVIFIHFYVGSIVYFSKNYFHSNNLSSLFVHVKTCMRKDRKQFISLKQENNVNIYNNFRFIHGT